MNKGSDSVHQTELDQTQTIDYWQEKIETDDFAWELTVASTSQGVCWVGLGEPKAEEQHLRAWVRRWYPKAILENRRLPNAQVLQELKEYFLGQREIFTLPLQPAGTPFQRRVWEELRKIPYGVTLSYGEIAQRIGNPKGQRAVGMANHNNPIGVIVPCHRVIGKGGGLTGYAGGVHLKEQLLKLENQKNG